MIKINTIDIETGEHYANAFYARHPRVGEIVEFDSENGLVQALKVVMVSHSLETITADLYVKNLGPLHYLIESLKNEA